MPHDPAPHPRLWGTFPRVLGHYCRDVGLFTLEQAVHKMTGKPAAYFRLPGRGRIAPGYAADVVVFDADRIKDVATWASPTSQAEGIDYVLVNGEIAWAFGAGSGRRSGQVLRRRDARARA